MASSLPSVSLNTLNLAAHVGCELNGEVPETRQRSLGIEIESVRPAERERLMSNGLQKRERCSCDPVAVRVGERKWHVLSSLLMAHRFWWSNSFTRSIGRASNIQYPRARLNDSAGTKKS